MKKEMTEQEAFLQLAALCAQAEHCEQEMRDKMKRWELDETVQNRIIERLAKDRYIDQERFARAFVNDKIREIDDQEYLSVLRPLLKQKRKSIKAQSDYELNQKLVRFALSRGFTFDIIRQCLDVDDEMEYADETD